MYKLNLIVLVCLLSCRTIGQEVRIESIIQTANTDRKLLMNQGISDFIGQQNFNLPWIREAELRLGINGNATPDKLDGYLRNEDYYAIKISPNSLRERRYQRALKPAQADYYRGNDHIIMQEAIFERYQSIVILYYAQQFLVEKEFLQPLLTKKAELITQMLDQGLDIRFKDVVDVEYDKNNLQSDLLEYSNIVNEETERIKAYLKLTGPININFDEFIQTEGIRNVVLAVDTSYTSASPEVIYTKYKANLSLAELNYQKSKNRQIFSFFQAGYSPVVVSEAAKTKFNPSNDLTFRFGVNIPIAANNNLKRSEAAIQLYEDHNDAIRTREKMRDEIALQKTKILQLIEAKNQWHKMFKESLIHRLLNNEVIRAQISPLELVDMEIAIIKIKLEGLELDDKIANEFIELLSLTGDLNNTGKNHLKGDSSFAD